MPLKYRRPQGFSRRERQALFALIFLLILVEAFGYLSRSLSPPPRRDVQRHVIYDTIRVQAHARAADHPPAREENTKSRERKGSAYSKPFTVLLNETDTFAWEALPGIGPTFARRILKYRSLLGGYAEKEQLGEVYGIDTAQVWYERVREDDAPLDSLFLNRDTIVRFWRHPYVSPPIAREWVRYRDRVGKFTRVEEVRKGYLMTDSIFYKIAPYLSVQ